MRFTSADDAVRAYYRLGRDLGKARGANVSMGVYPAVACGKAGCTGTRFQESFSRRRGVRLTCATCGRDWKLERASAGGRGGVRPRVPGEEQLNLRTEIGLALKRLPLWRRRAIVLYAMWRALPDFADEIATTLDLTPWQRGRLRAAVRAVGCERRDDDVGRLGNAVWPRKAGGWGRRVVRELLDGPYGARSTGARARLEVVLDRKGLWERRAHGG